MVKFIDDWLLDNVFQKAADWFCDQYHRTPFWIASTCIFMHVVLVLTENLFEEQNWLDLGIEYVIILIWLVTAWMFDLWGKHHERMKTRTRNPWRIDPLIMFIRLLNLVLVTINLVLCILAVSIGYSLPLAILEMGIGLTVVCAYYFASCDTKPPSPKPVEQRVKVPQNAVHKPT